MECYQETSSQHPRADTERIKWVAAAIINCRVSQNTAPTPYNVYSSSFMCLQFTGWCSSVPIIERPMQKSSYVHISYVGASKEMKIVENYEMKFVFLDSPAEML